MRWLTIPIGVALIIALIGFSRKDKRESSEETSASIAYIRAKKEETRRAHRERLKELEKNIKEYQRKKLSYRLGETEPAENQFRYRVHQGEEFEMSSYERIDCATCLNYDGTGECNINIKPAHKNMIAGRACCKRYESKFDCERARELIINLYVKNKINDTSAHKSLLKHLKSCTLCSKFLLLTKEEWIIS